MPGVNPNPNQNPNPTPTPGPVPHSPERIALERDSNAIADTLRQLYGNVVEDLKNGRISLQESFTKRQELIDAADEIADDPATSNTQVIALTQETPRLFAKLINEKQVIDQALKADTGLVYEAFRDIGADLKNDARRGLGGVGPQLQAIGAFKDAGTPQDPQVAAAADLLQRYQERENKVVEPLTPARVGELRDGRADALSRLCLEDPQFGAAMANLYHVNTPPTGQALAGNDAVKTAFRIAISRNGANPIAEDLLQEHAFQGLGRDEIRNLKQEVLDFPQRIATGQTQATQTVQQNTNQQQANAQTTQTATQTTTHQTQNNTQQTLQGVRRIVDVEAQNLVAGMAANAAFEKWNLFDGTKGAVREAFEIGLKGALVGGLTVAAAAIPAPAVALTAGLPALLLAGGAMGGLYAAASTVSHVRDAWQRHQIAVKLESTSSSTKTEGQVEALKYQMGRGGWSDNLDRVVHSFADAATSGLGWGTVAYLASNIIAPGAAPIAGLAVAGIMGAYTALADWHKRREANKHWETVEDVMRVAKGLAPKAAGYKTPTEAEFQVKVAKVMDYFKSGDATGGRLGPADIFLGAIQGAAVGAVAGGATFFGLAVAASALPVAPLIVPGAAAMALVGAARATVESLRSRQGSLKSIFHPL